jgi:flagellar protein FlaG
MNISSITNNPAIAHAPDPVSNPAISQDNRNLVQAVKAVNGAELFGQSNELSYILDRNTHRTVVRIVNKDTREVVAQIPSETVLRLAEEIK